MVRVDDAGRRIVPLIAAIFLMGAGLRQDLPAVTESHGAFAFPNLKGTALLVRHTVPHASEIRTAICGGRTIPIRFARHQAPSDARSADRDTPAEFDRLAGTVFEVRNRSVSRNETCFVASAAFLESADVFGIRSLAKPIHCTQVERRSVAALRSRAIKTCWSIGEVGRGGLVALVEYERAQENALASLVIATEQGPLIVDFAATYRGEGEDLWRVEDGGTFYPDGFTVPFVVRRGTNYFVAVDWLGTEGNSLSLYSAAPRTPARQLIEDYWYRAPR